MFTRARLIWTALLAAATTATFVDAPALIHAGISFRALD